MHKEGEVCVTVKLNIHVHNTAVTVKFMQVTTLHATFCVLLINLCEEIAMTNNYA